MLYNPKINNTRDGMLQSSSSCLHEDGGSRFSFLYIRGREKEIGNEVGHRDIYRDSDKGCTGDVKKKEGGERMAEGLRAGLEVRARKRALS